MPWLLRMTLVVSLIMAPAVIYLMWRYFQSTKTIFDQRWTRVVVPVLLISFYAFPVSGFLDFYLTGSIDILKYFKPVVYWFWFGLVFVYLLLTWVIIADVIKFISRFFTHKKETVSNVHARVILVLLPVLFLFTGWKTYDHTTSTAVTEITLSLEEIPSVLQDFKIIHISDIQGDEYTGEEDIAEYIRLVNEQNPDLIVFTGDLISYGTDFIQMAARALGEAEATYGTLAVVGDHDFWAGVEHVEQALAEQGIPLLRDENMVLNLDSTASVLVTGVTEVYSKESDPQVVDSLMDHADGQDLKILASHQIDGHLIENAIEHSYDLALAGHTHGGQIRVPFMGMTFSASDLETDFV
ncbi:MAG TPA: metallophosphoesterase, partial [Balneolaceae bacterium]